VVKCGYARADVRDSLEVDVRKADADIFSHVEEHVAPRVDYEAVTEGVPPVLVRSDLCRSNDEEPGFDCASA
jgi:hypothetical protein